MEWLHGDVPRYGHHIRTVSVLEEQNPCTHGSAEQRKQQMQWKGCMKLIWQFLGRS
jgi:hypothetical protein